MAESVALLLMGLIAFSAFLAIAGAVMEYLDPFGERERQPRREEPPTWRGR